MASAAIDQNIAGAAAAVHEGHDQGDQDEAEQEIERVLKAERDRRSLHQRLQLGEGYQRAAERDGADAEPERHFDQALRVDVARCANIERAWRGQRRGGDEHGGQADERVERGHKLGQRRHLDAPRDVGAGGAADRDAGQNPLAAAGPHSGAGQRREGGDRHAHHAVLVAAPRRDGGWTGRAAPG